MLLSLLYTASADANRDELRNSCRACNALRTLSENSFLVLLSTPLQFRLFRKKKSTS